MASTASSCARYRKSFQMYRISLLTALLGATGCLPASEPEELDPLAELIGQIVTGDYHGVARVLEDFLQCPEDVARVLENVIAAGDYRARPTTAENFLRCDGAMPQFLHNLAGAYQESVNHPTAAQVFDLWLAIYVEEFGMAHPDVAEVMDDLATLYTITNRLGDALNLHLQAREIKEAILGPNHHSVGITQLNLGTVYSRLERFRDAEREYLRGIEIFKLTGISDNLDLAEAMEYLGTTYTLQMRIMEAFDQLFGAREIKQEVLGPQHPEPISLTTNIGNLFLQSGNYGMAEDWLLEAWLAAERTLGPDHPNVGLIRGNLGVVSRNLGNLYNAFGHLEAAIGIVQRTLGPDDPGIAGWLAELGLLQWAVGEFSKAAQSLDRAVSILEDQPSAAYTLIIVYDKRAQFRYGSGNLAGALTDVEKALRLLEDFRPGIGGGNLVRAGFVGAFHPIYGQMVSWQLEAGEPDLALNWLERGRARVLLDQLAAAQIDLRSSIPTAELEPLVARETDARFHQARYQARITSLDSRSDLMTGEQRDARIALLEDSLALADADYRQVYQDIESASPLWQELLTSGGNPVGLAEMQRDVVPSDGLLLIYEIGDSASHVFVVPPEGGELEVVSLDVTSESLEEQVPPGAIRASNGLGALRTLHAGLFPDGLWDRVQGAGEVIVIPDGALHRLPFEALVVSGGGEEARYWLDDGPPVRYAASATVLYNIESRPSISGSGVLSVSDPVFDPEEFDEIEIETRADPVRAAFERAGGSFNRLPYTAEETDSIRAAFGPDEVTVLQELDATEWNLRNTLGDHRYLHLATHGRVDERRGSLYGSLALTAASRIDPLPDDDGFLELREVYGLDLGSVMLAVLSACETNVGESYEGEGMFALSRGFLAAGAQRVVATQWQVSDRATAALVGRFFRIIANAEQASETVDYAGALRDAKRSLRTDPDNPEWVDPYYWAAFTITGQR